MTWLQKVKAFLKSIGFDVASKTDDELIALGAAAGITKEDGDTDPNRDPKQVKTPSKTDSEIIEELRRSNEALTALATNYKAIETARTAQTEAEAKAALKAKIQLEIAQGKKDARIPAGSEGDALKLQQQWEKLFELDFATAKDAFDKLPKSTTPANADASTAVQQVGATKTPRSGLMAQVRSDAIADYAAAVPIAK